MPKISIIVPCYNQSHYLDEALQSVLDQTYSYWECIIINDGSTDHTEEIALAWSKKDDRFIYIKKENGGLSSARNFGMESAKGNYIQFLDSDDILDNRKLELSLSQLNLEENKEKIIAISNFRMFTDNCNNSTGAFCTLIPDLFNFRAVLLKWESVFSIPIHCALFDINLLKDFRFPEELKAKEDWIMWLYLFQQDPNVCFINEPLVYYRSHQKSMTTDAKHMLENHMKAILYLRTMIPETDYIDFLLFELQQKYSQTTKLRTMVYNYQNSATYRIAQKIKTLFLLKQLYKIIKK
jgi:glycosyltransferase involved in cell wall biosynthesis